VSRRCSRHDGGGGKTARGQLAIRGPKGSPGCEPGSTGPGGAKFEDLSVGELDIRWTLLLSTSMGRRRHGDDVREEEVQGTGDRQRRARVEIEKGNKLPFGGSQVELGPVRRLGGRSHELQPVGRRPSASYEKN
jgi:hypothetical protein